MQRTLPVEDNPRVDSFPETRYMGSKRRLLGWIGEHVSAMRLGSVLDAFSGSACVSYMFKAMGAEVHSNDFLHFAYHIARATVENNATRLDNEDLRRLLAKNVRAGTFIRDVYSGLYFTAADCAFLDHLRANIDTVSSPLKRSLALAAASRACMKKRPRGIFTFVGRKGWDNRRDLRLSMAEQFCRAVSAFNEAVFSNQQRNRAFCRDVFQLEPRRYDLVYIDTPYIGPYSDADYTRRYHFVEGFCRKWEGVEIMDHTVTKKIRSYATAFSSRKDVLRAFERLFAAFRHSALVVSYSSNGFPDEREMVRLLKEVKRTVVVRRAPLMYSHGNHGHKIDSNHNQVTEYLFIGT